MIESQRPDESWNNELYPDSRSAFHNEQVGIQDLIETLKYDLENEENGLHHSPSPQQSPTTNSWGWGEPQFVAASRQCLRSGFSSWPARPCRAASGVCRRVPGRAALSSSAARGRQPRVADFRSRLIGPGAARICAVGRRPHAPSRLGRPEAAQPGPGEAERCLPDGRPPSGGSSGGGCGGGGQRRVYPSHCSVTTGSPSRSRGPAPF